MSNPRINGFSYVEVLVAVALLAIALVPAMDALRGGLMGADVHATQTELQYRITGKLEELLAEPFAALDDEAQALGDPLVASALYSDPVATPGRRLVFLSRYDGDNVDPADSDPFTGVDEGLIWLRVEIEHTPLALERLVHAGD